MTEKSVIESIKPRLVYADIRQYDEQSILLFAPTGDMFHIDLLLEEVQALLHMCDGTRTVAEIASTSADPELTIEILTELVETPCFTNQIPVPNEAMWARFTTSGIAPQQLADTELLLVGDVALTDMVHQYRLAQEWKKTTIVPIDKLEEVLSGSDSQTTMMLLLKLHMDAELFETVDALCDASGMRWASFHIEQGSGWLGPAIIPGRTANYHDLLVRRLSVSESRETFEAEMAAAANATKLASLVQHSEQVWMLSALMTEVERWVVGAPCRLISVEVQADPINYTLTEYPVLPLPDHVLTGDLLISAPKEPETLINDRCGIVIRTVEVEHHPSIPLGLKTFQTHLAHMVWHYPTWHNDTISGGSAFGDAQMAYQAALGEAAERYCGNFQPGAEPIKATYKELQARGEYAVDPEQLTLFSDTMYATDGCPFVPFTRDLPVYWVQGRSLTQDRPAWIPMSLVYVDWHTGDWEGEPIINPSYYPGIAAGLSLDHAIASGLEELVERDITMVWWLNRHPLPAVQPTPELLQLWEGKPTELNQRAWLIPLPNEFDMPVMAGVVENTEERLLDIGFACRHNPVQAALKAWTEALTLQEGSRDLDDPNGLLRQGIEWGWVIDVFKPWRKDRRYLDDYRKDFRDVVGLLAQQQVFLDERAIERVRPWVDVPVEHTFDELPHLPERSLSLYRERIEGRGYEIFYYDMTAADIARVGMRSVRVIVPGLVPNFPAAFPPTGNGRVQTLPVKLGWRETPLAEDELNYMPIPYA
ncbi:MAG: YcaO-like family protein [Chloroflexota bacterium]